MKIDWAYFCDTAFIDRYERVCIIGLTTRIPVPTLPMAVRQSVVVARLSGAAEGTKFDFGFRIVAPSGGTYAPGPADQQNASIEVANEYLLITLRDMPLQEEGVYKIVLTLNGADAATIDLTVLVKSGGVAGAPPKVH